MDLPVVDIFTNHYLNFTITVHLFLITHQTFTLHFDACIFYLDWHMYQGIEFFTATCLYWQMLLNPNERKDILMDSLRFMVQDRRIWLYGFVIMPNHIHLMWRRQDAWLEKNIEQIFLKFTAQQIKFKLLAEAPQELELYRSTQRDRSYHFWERRSYKATMHQRKVAKQKIDYMHYNPVKAGLCKRPEDYPYSSCRFYELNQDDWGFITHYEEHL